METSIIILIVLLALVLGWIMRTGRSRRLRRRLLAGRLRLRYSVQDHIGLAEQLGGLYLMQMGHSGRIQNVIHGRRGTRQVFAFDYHYELGAGAQRRVRRYTVAGCAEPLEGEILPGLVALREGELLPLGMFQGYQLLQAGSGVKIYSDNPEQGGKLLGRLGQLPEMNWEFWMGNLVVYSQEELSPTRIARLLTRCRRCRRGLERHD